MTDSALRISLFEGVSDPAFAQAVVALPVRGYPKGMVIFEQGEGGQDVFQVVAGRVELVRRNAEGDLVRVALLGPGEVFGEFAYLSGKPRTAAAVAFDDVSLVEMSPQWIRQQEQRCTQVRDRLLSLYRSRVLVNILSAHKLFSVLPQTDLEELAAQLVLRRFVTGETLLVEGAHDFDLFILRRGTVGVFKQKGQEKVKLGELGTGEVLGEMAMVTGEARSATARALTEVDAMVLPGTAFQHALGRYPALLSAIEDIVRSRAAATREALEDLISEVVGEEWADVTDSAGIAVESLNVAVAYEAEGISGESSLLRVSRSSWTLNRLTESLPVANGTAIRLFVKPGRIKELSGAGNEIELSGRVTGCDEKTISVSFDSQPQTVAQVVPVVTALARARFRLFVYPEYDVHASGISLKFKTVSGVEDLARVSALSQTNGFLPTGHPWPSGELATVTLLYGDREILNTKALSLGEKDDRLEFQFEYDTGSEREGLEKFLQDVAKDLGYGQLAMPSVAAAPRRRASASSVLTKHFRSSTAFLKEYVGSIEAGLVSVPAKNQMARGTQVRVQIMIGGRRGTAARIGLTGLIRQWDEGIAEVELDELTPLQRERIGALSRKLVEERAQASWKTREKELKQTKQKRPLSSSEKFRRRVGVALLVLTFVSLSFLALLAVRQRNKLTRIKEAEVKKAVTRTRTKQITFETAEQEKVTLRSSEIRSVQLKDEGELFRVQGAGKNFTVAAQEGKKLTPFQQKQVERLIALRAKK